MEHLEPGRTYHIYNRGINSCRLFDDSADFNHFMMLYQRFMIPVVDTFAWVLMSNHFHLLVRIKENLVYRYSRGEDGEGLPESQRGQESQRLQEGQWQQESQRLQVSDAGVLAGSNLPSSNAVNRPSSPESNLPSSSDMEALLTTDATWNLLKWQTMPMDGDGVGEGRKIPSATHHLSHLFNAYAKYYNTRHGRHGSLFERAFKRKVIDSKDYFQNVILYIHQNPVHHNIVQHPSRYIWSSYNTYLAQDDTWLAKNEVFDLFGDRANFEFCHNNCCNNCQLDDWEE